MSIGTKSGGVFASFVEGFFAPLAEYMADPSVSEILVNGPGTIYVEQKGAVCRAPATFDSEASLMSALRAVAQYLGRPFDEDHPILEGRLPDGSRLQAVVAPLAQGGPCVAIRRHRVEALTWQQLIQGGSISEEAHAYLHLLVRGKKNILVSGGTGSGKTSILRLIAGLSPPDDRIITIEDARELALQAPHVVSLESRPHSEGRQAITIRDLFVATLRLRPDRIVIGELRAGEALDLVQAMTSGHGGCLSTIHASSPADALRRLETLCLYSGVELPLAALRAQIASAVDAIVQVERTPEGRRWVQSIADVEECTDGYRVAPAFERSKGSARLEWAAGASGGLRPHEAGR